MLHHFLPLIEQLSTETGLPLQLLAAQAIAGGDCNTAYCLKTQHGRYFVKLNQANMRGMFAAEYAGLQELRRNGALRVPEPILCGQTPEQAFLVLEWLNFERASATSERLLGQQLAQLHQTQQPYFGWTRENTIGLTSQVNTPQQDWLSFWRTQRLGTQLRLAENNGYRARLQQLGERLLADLNVFFTTYQPQASLLHGDLWGGNVAVLAGGQPVLFDPACYFGDREADLAMTELFGGFSSTFYAAYREVWPLDAGYAVRKDLYNLYHVLNHLNMFGGGYLRQSEQLLAKLLAET